MTLKPIEASLFDKLPEDIKLPLRQSGVVTVADPLLQLWNLPKETNLCVLIGGRAGMKTWNVSDFVAHQAAVNKKRCVVLRDEKSLIKTSILNEILNRFDAIPFHTDTDRLSTGLKDTKSGKDLVFTMGFRASDNTKKANMKGVSDIDIAIIEEAEDITDRDRFNTFVDSLRKEGCLVIVILNTPDIGHFILENYFDTIDAPIPDVPEQYKKDFEGYFQIIPKKNIPGFVAIQTGYKQNKWLPQHIIDRYEAYGNPESNTYNPHYYMTAIKGYASTGRKGQVLKKVQPISLRDYMALPFKEYYGQDFGTAAPAGFVGVKFDKNNCYCREINYLPMNVLEIGKLYCSMKLNAGDKIVADCADEKAIKKLKNGFTVQELSKEDLQNYPALLKGFFIVPCVKGPDSVRTSIDLADTLNLFAVSESLNLWEEIRMRIYAQDKNGNYTNEPEPGYDHLQDPWMYLIVDRYGKKKTGGSISV